MLVGSMRNDVDLNINSTQLPLLKKEWFNKRKDAKAYIYPRFFNKQSRCFLKVATVSQLHVINDIGKLFHTSIIRTVKFPNIQMHLWFVDFEYMSSQTCA